MKENKYVKIAYYEKKKKKIKKHMHYIWKCKMWKYTNDMKNSHEK